MKQLRRAITPITLALISAPFLIAAVASPVWAIKRCAPLLVNDNTAECKVANYGTSPDTNVKITLYNLLGTVLEECGPLTIPAKGSIWCAYIATEITDVSCEVTGEGSTARVSLSVYAPGAPSNSGAAVDCR